jgi:hypothetical protein
MTLNESDAPPADLKAWYLAHREEQDKLQITLIAELSGLSLTFDGETPAEVQKRLSAAREDLDRMRSRVRKRPYIYPQASRS